MKYRKKQYDVDAEQYTGSNQPLGQLIIGHACNYRMCPLCGGSNQPNTYVKTDDEVLIIKVSDYLVREPNGDYYVYSKDDFEQNYTNE
jgi:hypothetical protein